MLEKIPDGFVHQKIKNDLPRRTLIIFRSKLHHYSYVNLLIPYVKNLESINGIKFLFTYLYWKVEQARQTLFLCYTSNSIICNAKRMYQLLQETWPYEIKFILKTVLAFRCGK
jgi:hypothetical protein